MDQKIILVVDDDANIRNILQDALQSFGHNCRTAVDGLEALELIKKESFDAVLCDIRMLGMDGLEVVKEARKIVPEVPFIMMTGFAHEYAYDQVIKAGAVDFIEKPLKISELEIKLNRVLDECLLFKKANRLNDRLSGLLSIARELSQEFDFDNLFPLIIEKVTLAMGAERTSLYIIDWDRREIWTRVAEKFSEIRLPVGHGISGRVAETGEIINATDAWDLPYFDKSFDLKSDFHTRSVLCLPLSNRQGERIAVIQVINKAGGDRFDEDDVQILMALSGFVGIALENSFLIEELEESFEGAIGTLAATVDARHPLTAGHSQRVTEYALAVAGEMNLDEDALKEIKYAGLLHDIGKIGIKDSVLLKEGRFSSEERSAMNDHTIKTLGILKKFHFSKKLRRVPLIAAYHHEKVNGKGYPFGLTGDELPLASKILAVADVFDALTSRRDYPKYIGHELLGFEPMPFEKVVGIMKAGRGRHFDSEVLDAFFRCIPRELSKYRGNHFPSEYVDGAVAFFEMEARNR